jgi:ketosteroid isomerase-like protein
MSETRADLDVRRRVQDVVEQWCAAEKAGDDVRLATMLAEGFVGIGPVGFVLDRDQWMARFGRGLRNRSFAVRDPQVHEHGSAAVVIGVLEQQTTFGDVDNSGRFRISLVAVPAGEEWRVASVHIGPLQAPPVSTPDV